MTIETPKCPNCGASVGIDMQECPYCGASVVTSLPSKALPSGVKCPKCFRHNEEGNAFCEFCGAELLLRCPRCRKPLLVGKAICTHCGTRIFEFLEKRAEASAERGNHSWALASAELLRQFDVQGAHTSRIAPVVLLCRAKLIALYEAHAWETARKQTHTALASWKKPMFLPGPVIYATPGVFKKEMKGLFWSTHLPPAKGLLTICSSADMVDIDFHTADERPSGWAGRSLGGSLPIITSMEMQHLSLATWPLKVSEDKLIIEHSSRGYRDVIFNMPKGSPKFIQDLLPQALAQSRLGNVEDLISLVHPSDKYSGW